MAGRKIEKAREAAKTFIGLLDLQHDQAGLVTFAGSTKLAHELTSDGAAVAAAIDQIALDSNTDIASAIISATQELDSKRHNPEALKVVILLSDGYSDEQAAKDAAQQAREAGIRLITIGLGKTDNEALLKAIAYKPEDYHFAPSPEQLEAIYISLAGDVHTCSAISMQDATPHPAATDIASPSPTISPSPNPAEVPTSTPTALPPERNDLPTPEQTPTSGLELS